MTAEPKRGTSGAPSQSDDKELTWSELIAVAQRFGYRGPSAHPELADELDVAGLARALTAAAMARRGGPLTELIGVAFSDQEFVEWVRIGKVPV